MRVFADFRWLNKEDINLEKNNNKQTTENLVICQTLRGECRQNHLSLRTRLRSYQSLKRQSFKGSISASQSGICKSIFTTRNLNPRLGIPNPRPRGALSIAPKTFRARKAIRKTLTRLFCISVFFICCKGYRNQKNCKVSCLGTSSFRRYKENSVGRNAPKNFRDFRETGTRIWNPKLSWIALH